MKLEKIKKTFGDYKLELSWGQIEAIGAALEANHSDSLADELYAEWKWYAERVPGPGEDEDAWEAQQKALEGGKGGGEGEDLPIPMPPGGQDGTPPEGGQEPNFPPEQEEDEGEGEPGGAGEEPGAEPSGLELRGEPGLPEPEPEATAAGPRSTGPEEDTDRRLPKPPRE